MLTATPHLLAKFQTNGGELFLGGLSTRANELSSLSFQVCTELNRSWLHYSRPDPPTPREIEISDAKAADLKRRVKALEEEDAKERVRQFASKMSSYDEHAQAQPQTVEQIAFRAMGGREEAGTTRSQNVSAEERDTHASPHMNEESAPQGEGESFRPGEWKPSTMRRRGRSG
uniref:NADH dehydrogenase [ubiquinone] 1 alpha subcomplex subunit 12 n=1 Tax=Rhodosorus marinus TaxID=101924 RepID=A0A7S3E5T4_9RHOD|mmetsp:Transcript_1122/g.3154  ORF Transcript_1122/g.3154 Transcript_1122/m.3154 type:complete len:173 (+) Transcript_1122:400-918(+)